MDIGTTSNGVNIQIMRAFVQLRGLILTHKELARRLEAMEARFGEHDSSAVRAKRVTADYSWQYSAEAELPYYKKIKMIFEAMKQLLEPPTTEKPKIGFPRH